MVHKKYIKRGGKTFGPYLYKNYRENGVTKTKYLGPAKERKKLRVNLFFILVIIFLILLLVSSAGLIFVSDKEDLKGELASKPPFDFLARLFTATSPVSVFVQIVMSNTPPEFFTRPPEILVCENKAVNETLLVRDSMGDNLGFSFYPDLGIRFRFNPERIIASGNWDAVNLFTRTLNFLDINKRRNLNEGWAIYPENIIVEDGLLSDSFSFNLVIIEVNDAPEFDIGVQTIEIYLQGEGIVFNYNLGDELILNGEETPKQYLKYNLTYQNGSISPFNISDLGVVNIVGNESYIISGNFTNYPLKICVNDTGLNRILHPEISRCLMDNPPQSEEPLGWCDNFTLTITKNNREPNITSYSPSNLSLEINGNNILYFNLTAYDPDWTPLDAYWYVNNISKGYYEGLEKNNVSKFEYFFDCGISGNYTVKAVVTDGLLNDSVQWNISVRYAECPQGESGGGGGGGGGGKLYCKEKWGCDEWMQCEHLYKLLEKGWPSKETELLIKERCNLLNYTKEFCGFQIRLCKDFSYCNTTLEKPPSIKECYYTENPNCTDNIKNCHNGSCEVLIDCGGPCLACPTCHDNIQNQGETGIDCGGICRPCIELPWLPIVFKSVITYSLIILLIIVLLLIARQIIKYTKFKKIFSESRIRNMLIRGGDNKIKGVAIGLFFVFFFIVLLFFANAYILNFGQANRFIDVSGVGEGLLANYGFINSIFNNLGMFFEYGPITNENSRLTIFDDTDTQVKRSGWEVYFYADYRNLGGSPVTNSDGNCSVRFQDSNRIYGGWNLMEYDSVSELWKNMSIFNYKGTYKFEVSCLYGAYTNGGEDNFTITNSVPEINNEQGSDWINFDGNAQNHDIWKCSEDSVCYYDFSANVTDLDINDVLFYSVGINTTLINYNLDNNTGILEVNITEDKDTGLERIELKVKDNDLDTLWRSALLEINISPVNDAPKFVNLENKIFNEGDLFRYAIYVEDEETNFPFKFNIDFVNCSNLGTRGNCTLFDYVLDEINGKVNINFTPTDNDVGSYIINFSVMDYSVLGNKTTSQPINFTVTPALWNSSLVLDYLLIEDENKFINLTKDILQEYQENVTFSYNLVNSEFPSFNSSFSLTNGLINIIPADADVGYNKVEIIATSQGISSFRIFNFSVLNVNDSVSVDGFTVNEKMNITGLRLSTYENTEGAGLYLYLMDDDFAIPQKDFYNESLKINLTIEGPNIDLFKFNKSGMELESKNIIKYSAEFDTDAGDVGEYNITVNVNDANNFSSDVLRFNLIVINRSYDLPNIIYPDEVIEFNMKENVSSNLIFRANHTVGDELLYEFYINGILRDSMLGPGNGTNFTWGFAPNFTDESYGNETKNLTMAARNPTYYSELYTSRIWNLTINHTNCPPILIKEIQDKGPVSYPYEFGIDLMNYFYDADYYDTYYNNTPEGILKFDVISNTHDSKITKRYTGDNWVYIGAFGATVEQLNINASDNQNFTLSNDFNVTFVPPETVPVPTPSGGSSQTVPIALKIIMAGQISAYAGDTVKIPLKLVNSGSKDFNDLNLSSSAFKNSSLFHEIKTSLDKTYFKILKPKQEENLTLTVYLGTNKTGRYEILVNVTSRSPKYTDWGKVYIDLMPINESQVRELIIFTEEIIASNPQCIEITEILKEAERYFQTGEYANARIKADEALNSCREAISQVSVPRNRIPDFIKSFGFSFYLFIAIIGAIALAIIAGLIYYFIRRRDIVKLQKLVQEKKEEDTKV